MKPWCTCLLYLQKQSPSLHIGFQLRHQSELKKRHRLKYRSALINIQEIGNVSGQIKDISTELVPAMLARLQQVIQLYIIQLGEVVYNWVNYPRLILSYLVPSLPFSSLPFPSLPFPSLPLPYLPLPFPSYPIPIHFPSPSPFPPLPFLSHPLPLPLPFPSYLFSSLPVSLFLVKLLIAPNNQFYELLKKKRKTFNANTHPLPFYQNDAFKLCLKVLQESAISLEKQLSSRQSIRLRTRTLLTDVFISLGPKVFFLYTLAAPISKLATVLVKNLL